MIPFRTKLLALAVSAFVRTLHRLVRVRHNGSVVLRRLEAEGKRYILTFWHGQLLLMFYLRYTPPIVVMVSQHRDSDIPTIVSKTFGVLTVRGSSTRGGAQALRFMKTKSATAMLAMTPDGPRGPSHVAKPGVVTAAQLTGHTVVPVAVLTKKKRFSDPGIISRFPFRSAECSFSTMSPSRFRAA